MVKFNPILGVRVCISERFEEQLKAYNVSLLYFFMGTLTLILIGVGLCFLFFVLQRSNINGEWSVLN